jgi:hypothetical protein
LSLRKRVFRLVFGQNHEGIHPGCDKADQLFVQAALEIYSPEHIPHDHAAATQLRDDVMQELSKLSPDS